MTEAVAHVSKLKTQTKFQIQLVGKTDQLNLKFFIAPKIQIAAITGFFAIPPITYNTKNHKKHHLHPTSNTVCVCIQHHENNLQLNTKKIFFH